LLDKDGCPDEASLKAIKEWDILEQGISGLLELIWENTNWADRQIEVSGKTVIRYVYHTGGWSGNEDVIEALRDNLLFWPFFWQKSTRGGHFYFKIEHPEWYVDKAEQQEKEKNGRPVTKTL